MKTTITLTPDEHERLAQMEEGDAVWTFHLHTLLPPHEWPEAYETLRVCGEFKSTREPKNWPPAR